MLSFHELEVGNGMVVMLNLYNLLIDYTMNYVHKYNSLFFPTKSMLALKKQNINRNINDAKMDVVIKMVLESGKLIKNRYLSYMDLWA